VGLLWGLSSWLPVGPGPVLLALQALQWLEATLAYIHVSLHMQMDVKGVWIGRTGVLFCSAKLFCTGLVIVGSLSAHELLEWAVGRVALF
jgi:hypothetical protein